VLDLAITGGDVADGTGGALQSLDIGIHDGRIARMTPHGELGPAAKVITPTWTPSCGGSRAGRLRSSMA
jgi:N-acyl-D-aspartate/D-glutamate deacylase